MQSHLPIDVAKWSLSKWQQMFQNIYGRRNDLLETEAIWHRMLEEIGELVIPMHRFYIPDLQWHLPDVFAWLCATVTRLDKEKSLNDIVWRKFQNGCPGCSNSENCSCPDIAEAIEKKPTNSQLKPTQELFDLPQPQTLDEWQKFFGKLYGKRNLSSEPLFLLGRMTQDIGETSRMFRQKTSIELIEPKIASIFAWLLGICNRYSASYEEEASFFHLSRITYEKYHDSCAKCHQSPCKCPSAISSVFISWPLELKEEKEHLEKEIKEQLSLSVVSFPNFEIAVPFGVMHEAFRKINQSDAAIILIGTQFSAPVYAEMLEAFYRLGPSSVFVAVKKSTKRDEKTTDLIKEISHHHIYVEFESNTELSKLILDQLKNCVESFSESQV